MDKLSLIFYACIASIIVWAFLKAFGVFNTPELVELFPMLAGAVAAGVGFGKVFTTQKNIDIRTKRISNQLTPVRERLTKIETTCEITHKRKFK